MSDPLAWLDETARARRAAGLRRTLSPREVVEPLVDLASNDYLGLARDPRVVEGAVAATRTWGAGSTGSRLVTGSTRLHAELEEELATFCGAEAALVFSSGYTANLGAVTALSGRGALVVSDVAAHASLVDAARLSRARVVVSRCSVPAEVDAVLAAAPETRRVVVTDGVDSVDGGLAPLPELAAVCRARGAVLLVDDAHGLGVRGPASVPGAGLVAEAGLAGERGIVVTATLSKSLGSQGGVVLGDADVIAHLIDAARSFIFDTGLAPAAAGAAQAALRVLRDEPERVAALHAAAASVAASARVAAPWAGSSNRRPRWSPWSSASRSWRPPHATPAPGRVCAPDASGRRRSRRAPRGCGSPPGPTSPPTTSRSSTGCSPTSSPRCVARP